MKRKNFRAMMCPIARTLDRVGEWWTMLILRDALDGITRFDQFQTSLDIAPNILTRRLNALVKAGLLERKLYSRKPPRHEYLLTDKSRDFWPVLVLLAAYGNRHFVEGGIATRLVDARTGEPIEVELMNRITGQPVSRANAKTALGPGADAVLKLRAHYTEARRTGHAAHTEWDAYAEARAAYLGARRPKKKSRTGRRP